MKAILLAVLLATQQQQPYIETFEVRLHNLDVVVTDAKGQPVNGLGKDDFVVVEDGIAQEVTNFAEYSESAGKAAGARDARAPEEQTTPPRRFIFFVDELSLHPSSRTKLLKNSVALMKNSMRPGDVASVIRPFGTDMVRQDFTSDQKAIEAALRKVMAESDTRTDTQTARELRFLQLQLADSSTLIEKNFAVRVYADIARRRVEQRLGQLRSLVASLGKTEGKKVLVLMTASLAAYPGREAFNLADVKMGSNPEVDAEVPGSLPSFPDLTPQIRELGHVAAANGVTIYALQPDVPLELAIGGGEQSRRQLTQVAPSTGRPMPPAHSLSENFFGLILDNTETTMVSLAETTGGRWFRGDGNIDDAFRQVGDDLRSYYSLAYRAHGNPDKARHVEVRVKGHPELKVRTRSEVLEKSTTSEMKDLTVANLLYPGKVNELGVRAVAGVPKKGKSRFTIPVETQIPMDKLTFLPLPDGRYRASFVVTYAATGERSDFIAGQERRQDVDIDESQFRTLPGKMFHYSSDVVVAPGHVRIAVGALDLTSKLSGFSTVEVDAR